MATYPYTSGPAALAKALEQLRRNFPPRVDAAYLRRFNIAPSNESYLIGILRFLDLIDEEGLKQDVQTEFLLGNDEKFKDGLDAQLRESYATLFAEMGEGAYKSSRDDLAHWFRGADKTSELIGRRQASTFLALAALAGKAEATPVRASAPPRPRANGARGGTKAKSDATEARVNERADTAASTPAQSLGLAPRSEVGLTVRIEINLPSGGDAETYDAIFASIKRHLIP